MTVSKSFFPESIRALAKWLLLAAGASFVVAFSIWQGAYNYDPHHWGLMFSNANDILLNKKPYKEIFIPYGILTTSIQALALLIWGQNLQSLIGVTAAFYALGLVGLFFLAQILTKNTKLSIFVFVTAVLLHPLAIYPWANYIAFPFFIWFCVLIFDSKISATKTVVAGLLLGCSVLSRENLFAPAIGALLLISIDRFVFKDAALVNKKNHVLYLLLAFGLLILSFFLAVIYYDLAHFWYQTSVLMPQTMAKMFLVGGVQDGLTNLTAYFVNGAKGTEGARAFLLSLMAASCVAVTIFSLTIFKSKKGIYFSKIKNLTLVSLISLMLLSSAIHLIDLFRLATGFSMAIILIYVIAEKLKIENFVFGLVAWLFANSLSGGHGNGFYVGNAQRSTAGESSQIAMFAGQRWPKNVTDFYERFDSDIKKIKINQCQIKFFKNKTHDAFLAVLTGFDQYQLAPYGHSVFNFSTNEFFDAMRPDLNFNRKINNGDQDIILIDQVEFSKTNEYIPPTGFYVAKSYVTPPSHFFKKNSSTLLVIPMSCQI
jgi:hypothetical protein